MRSAPLNLKSDLITPDKTKTNKQKRTIRKEETNTSRQPRCGITTTSRRAISHHGT